MFPPSSLLALHTLLVIGRADEHPVCHDGHRFVSWREFSNQVAAYAAYFAVRPQARWLLVSDDPYMFLTQLLALLHAGKQVVIPPNTQPDTLIELASAFDVIADHALPTCAVPLVTWSALNPHTTGLDLYTSGSTGTPKRVHKTLAQLVAEIKVLEALWGLTLGDATIVATTPHQHLYGLLFRLLWPLCAGRAFDKVCCTHPDLLRQRLALLQNTVLISSPAQLSRLPQLLPLHALQPAPRLIFSSGGPLSVAAADAFHAQLGRAPLEVFGSTETGAVAWRSQESGVTAWTPLPSITVAADTDAALLLNSPFLPPHAAPARMEDAIELLPEGRFYLHGRLDRIVKIEEKRLSLAQLELHVAQHPWVHSAAAVLLTGTRHSVGVALVLTPIGVAQLQASGRRAMTEELRRHLATRFETVLLPRRWRFVDALPHNERGKLIYAKLTQLFDAHVAA